MGTEAGTQAPPRRVILLAGPSGSGKSTMVRAAGLPMVYLDDFYKAGSDPSLPRHPELGIVDWDHPDSWDREAALAALQQANRRLDDIIDFLPDPTLVIDQAGRVIAWNRAMEAMTSVPKAAILGQGDHAHPLGPHG